MVKPKPKSKRTPVRLRHKIEKAGAAKQRKQRKLAKKNPEWRSRLKKDPGIPNLFPYKEKLLHEIEEKRRLKEGDLARRRKESNSRKSAGDDEPSGTDEDDMSEGSAGEAESTISNDQDIDMNDTDSGNPMAALLASAKARATEYDANGIGASDDDDIDEDGDDESTSGEMPGSTATVQPLRRDASRKAFDKVFKQVIDTADVVLYVLDARDPEGTRSKEVERSIMAAEGGEKRLILIVNKIDLVPPPVLQGWLTHLRRYFPTLPFRASGGAANAQTFNHRQLTAANTSASLFRALKSYAHSKQLKRSISVGVIGYPNVGKSSVINALTSRLGGGANACPVGAEAGVTTCLRQVKLDSKLKVLDSPGIIFPSTSKGSDSDERARLVLLNAVPPKQIEDPIPAVALLLGRLGRSEESFSKLLNVYGLPPLVNSAGDPTTDFLVQVARKRGRLGKGGVPNLYSAASTVITDWRDGRIQGWVDAPTLQMAVTNGTEKEKDDSGIASAGTGDQKEIVTEWAKEFSLDGLWGVEDTSASTDAMAE
ncbi:MAG: hypothetical protein M1817_001593 [Caeruleum heppii]|nr:MAG: hypothetical protein M1817_001593 [Caeruleum heppii]